MEEQVRRRRSFITRGLLALIAGALGKKALGEEKASALGKQGEAVTTHMWKGRPPFEPLDTMLLFERSDEHNSDPMTHEILSLEHEERGRQSYPWTVYSHLTTHHEVGDACVFCSRLHKNNRGWSAGYHSEVFSNGPMVGLGANIEMSNTYGGDEKTVLIGVNVQTLGPNNVQYGMQIHGEGVCEKGIGLNGKGQVGLDVAGRYDAGIHMHGNSIRLDEGTCIELDGQGKVRLRYRQGRIEFLNGDKCVGHIDVDGEDHRI
jgi:hypothetical protein